MTPFHKTEKQVLRLFRLNPELAQTHLAVLIGAARKRRQKSSDLERLAVRLISRKQLKREIRWDKRA